MPTQPHVTSPAELRRLVDQYDWTAFSERLRAILLAQQQGVASGMGGDEAFDLEDPFTEKFFTSYVGERLTQLLETTKDRLIDALRSKLDAGTAGSPVELASDLRAVVADSYWLSPDRALAIARTETGITYNHATVLRAHQGGSSHVDVSDGDGDPECAAADGEVWTIEEALADPLEHPNCTRSFAPHEKE